MFYPQGYQQGGLFSVGLNSLDDLCHLVVNVATLVHVIGDFLVGIHNSGVIAATKQLTDFWQ